MKTTITKIFAVILAAVMCASLAACNRNAPKNDIEDNKNSNSASNNQLVNVVDDDKQEGEDESEGESEDEGEGEGESADDGDTTENDGEETGEDTASPEEDATTNEESTLPEEETEEDNKTEESDTNENGGESETVVITTGEEQQPAPAGKGEAVAQTAESAVGYDFLFGGDSPEDGGFDNSGLIYYAFTENGINCPRQLSEIIKIGTEVGYDDLSKGDAVFFKMTDGSDVIFGGVYVGDGKAVMSFSEGIPVKTVDITTEHYKNMFVKGVRTVS